MVTQTLEEGYKQTEIGVIPEDWDVKTFDEVFKFLPTGTHPRSDLSEQGEVNYVHYGDIHAKWNLILDCDEEEIPFISIEKIGNLPFIEEGDLIIADASEDYAGIGASVEIKNVRNRKIVSGLHTILLRGNKEKIVNGYKAYLTSISAVKKALISKATGISVYGISKNNVKTTNIPLPADLREQSVVAQVLSDTEALLKALDKLVEKKKNIKQGAMQELLTGKKRLPGFSEQWEAKKLAKIGHFKGGSGFPLKYQKSVAGKYPFFKVSDMNNEGNDIFMFSSNNYVSETEIKDMGASIFPKDTIVFAKIGAAIFLERRRILSTNSCVDNNMMGFMVDKSQASHRFMYYILTQINFGRLASTTALPSLNGKELGGVDISIPTDPREQEEIARVLSEMDSEIEELEQKRDKYQKLKIGMMQQLLTGRIRL